MAAPSRINPGLRPSSSSERSCEFDFGDLTPPSSPTFPNNKKPKIDKSSSVVRSVSSAAFSSSAAATAAFSLSPLAVRQISRSTAPPPPPRKIRPPRSGLQQEEPTCQGYTFKHFTEPSIIDELSLISLIDNGEYKKAWWIPEGKSELISGIPNSDLLILTFFKNSRNSSVLKVYKHMESSINQYNQAVTHFGQDKCVRIFNAATALENGYFIVKKIDLSLEAVLKNLHPDRKFTSMDQLTALNADETMLLDLLAQIKELFDLSLEHRIDTDLHVANFRLERKETETGFRLLLIDFREVVDKYEVAINKTTEIRNLKAKLASFFSSKFIDEYFADTIANKDKLRAEEESASLMDSFDDMNEFEPELI